MGNGVSSFGVKRKRVFILYIYGFSVSVRVVWMTVKVVEIFVRFKYIDLFKGEYKISEFVKVLSYRLLVFCKIINLYLIYRFYFYINVYCNNGEEEIYNKDKVLG